MKRFAINIKNGENSAVLLAEKNEDRCLITVKKKDVRRQAEITEKQMLQITSCGAFLCSICEEVQKQIDQLQPHLIDISEYGFAYQDELDSCSYRLRNIEELYHNLGKLNEVSSQFLLMLDSLCQMIKNVTAVDLQ